MRRIAVINQKGGVGKTTTAVNVGSALAAMGQRVLLLDLDPQAHLTIHLGVEPSSDRAGVYAMLTRNLPVADARCEVRENLWLVPSHIDLAATEIELLTVMGREMILRDLLDADPAPWDYVLMDCPPSLGVLTLNVLVAATEVLIPLQPHVLALQGMSKLLETISLVSQRLNPTLKVAGVVLCMNEQGTRLAAEVVEDLRGFLEASRDSACPWSEARVFDAVVRRNIKLAECPGYGQSIFEYAPRSNGAGDYRAVASELTGRAGEVEPKESPSAGPRALAVSSREEAEPPATASPTPAAPVPASLAAAPAAPVVERMVDADPAPEPERGSGADPVPAAAIPDFGAIPYFGRSPQVRRGGGGSGVPVAAASAALHPDLGPWGKWAYNALAVEDDMRRLASATAAPARLAASIPEPSATRSAAPTVLVAAG